MAQIQIINTVGSESDLIDRDFIMWQAGKAMADDTSIPDSKLPGLSRVIRDTERFRSGSLMKQAGEPGVKFYTEKILPQILEGNESGPGMTTEEFQQFSQGVKNAKYRGEDLSPARDVIFRESARRSGMDIQGMNMTMPTMSYNFTDAITEAGELIGKHGKTAALLGLSMAAGGAIIGQAFYDRMPSRSMMGADGYQDPDGMFVPTPAGFPNIASTYRDSRATGANTGYDIEVDNVQGHASAANIIEKMKTAYGSAQVAQGSHKRVTDDDVKAMMDRMI